MVPEFELEKHGYNKKQVDEYIDYLRDEYEKVVGICGQLQMTVQKLEKSLESQSDVAQVMITIYAFARKIKNEADQKAAQIIEVAKARADEITEQAEQTRHQVQEGLEDIFELLLPMMREGSENSENNDTTDQNAGGDRQRIFG